MEWFIAILAVFVLLVFINVNTNKKTKQARDDAARDYSEAIATAKKQLLVQSDRASLPVLDASKHNYRPVAKENLLAIQDGADRLEFKSTGKYRTKGMSVSIPIVKGVRYRVGSGSVRTAKEWRTTAKGRLLVTEKALAFESNQKNERITWNQISDIEILTDGFKIFKRSGPPRVYQVATPDPMFSAVVELMLSRAA